MHRSAEMNAARSPPCFHSLRGGLAASTNFVLSSRSDEDQQAGSHLAHLNGIGQQETPASYMATLQSSR
jgi:hypothetical protein